jgi:hypothetical protein
MKDNYEQAGKKEKQTKYGKEIIEHKNNNTSVHLFLFSHFRLGFFYNNQYKI